MARHPKIPETICDDEVVRYLAERYRTTPQSVVRRFLEQSGGRMSDGVPNPSVWRRTKWPFCGT